MRNVVCLAVLALNAVANADEWERTTYTYQLLSPKPTPIPLLTIPNGGYIEVEIGPENVYHTFSHYCAGSPNPESNPPPWSFPFQTLYSGSNYWSAFIIGFVPAQTTRVWSLKYDLEYGSEGWTKGQTYLGRVLSNQINFSIIFEDMDEGGGSGGQGN